MLSDLCKKSQIYARFHKFPTKTGYKNVICDLCFVICVFRNAPLSKTDSESGDIAISDGEDKGRENLEVTVCGDQLDLNFKYEMAKKDGNLSTTERVLKI
jgi:hypothetical protein